MFVKEIWRYPVKSMAGELMQSVRLSSQGIEGDRVVQVRGGRGRKQYSFATKGRIASIFFPCWWSPTVLSLPSVATDGGLGQTS